MVNLSVKDANTIHILRVDDDPAFLDVSTQILLSEGNFDIDSALSVNQAMEKMLSKDYDVIVSDYQMPQKDGLEFLKQLREQNNLTPFILFTGKGREEVVIKALNLGADAYHDKNGAPEVVYGELCHSIRLVVDRNKAKQALVDSEKRYHTLIDQAVAAICVHDLGGRILDANQRFCRSLGYTREELLKMRVSDVDSEAMGEDRKDFLLWPKVIEGTSFTFEAKHKRKDGTVFPVEISLGPINLGNETFVMALAKDITIRKTFEQKLVESEERYRSIVELSPDGIITSTLTGEISSVNQAFLDLTGLSRVEIVGRHFTKLGTLRARDMPKYIRLFANVLRGKVPPSFEFSFLRKDSCPRDADARISVLKVKGKTVGFQIILRDITERKQAEVRIRESEAKYRLLFECAGDYIFVFEVPNDGIPIIRDANSSALEMHGYTREELVNQPLSLIDKQIDVEFTKNFMKASANKTLVFEAKHQRKDGTVFYVEVSLFTMKIGDETRVVSIERDITERKKAEKKLADLNEKLHIVGGLTRHDVGNKIAVVKSNNYLLKKRLGDNLELRPYFEEIDRALRDADRLFDFSRLYEKIGSENPTCISVGDCFNEAIELFPDIKKIKVTNQTNGLKVTADSLLRQLFYNLIENTLKHGEKTTSIKLSYAKDEGGIKLIYEDDGIGVPEVNKARIFVQVYSSGKGTGLGLKFVSRMLEVYGWKITEDGIPGKGARFVISIPKLSVHK